MADTIGVSGEYNLEEVVLISASGTPTQKSCRDSFGN